MRLVGLDVGDRRVGLATAETEVGLAFPLKVIQRTGDNERDIKVIEAACRDEMPDMVIVGIPFLMSGEEGEQARKTLSFIEDLRGRLTVPIETVDERLTSWQAQSDLQQLGYSPKARRQRIDAAAAALILEAYMQLKASNGDQDQ